MLQHFPVFLFMLCIGLCNPIQVFAAGSASDQLDELDRQELTARIDRAKTCGRSGDFSCAEKQLKQAGSYANSSKDRELLKNAWAQLELDKQRIYSDEAKRKYSGERIALEDQNDRARLEAEELRQSNIERTNSRIAANQQRVQQPEPRPLSVAESIQQGLAQTQRDQARLNDIHNDAMDNLRRAQMAQAEVRERQAEAQRRQSEAEHRAAEERNADRRRREQASADRAQQVALAEQAEDQKSRDAEQRRAEEQQRKKAEQLRIAEQERALEQAKIEQARAAEQSRLAEKARVDEQRKQAALAAQQAAASAPDALAFCWQSDKGNWFCDGRVDETTLGEKELESQLSGVGCKQPQRVTNSMVTLTSLRVPERGSKTGWLYRCGDKLKAGDTGHATWNRDIRRFWSGIRW